MFSAQNAFTSKGVDALYVATALRTTSRAISSFDGCSFLYDPNWISNPAVSSLPIVFLHTITCTETQHNTTAQKRVIVYTDGSNTANAKQLSEMTVVSDNNINDPVKYKLEAVMPASGFDTLFNPTTKALDAVSESFTESGWASGAADALEALYKITATQTNITTIISSLLGILESLSATTQVKTYIKAEVTATLTGLGINGNFFNSLDVPINKNSLAQMTASRHILTLKNWDSWDYKYVVVTDSSIVKSGENGDNYMVTLELQEFPVMVLYNAVNGNPTGASVWYTAVQAKISSLVKTIVATFGGLGT